MSGTSRGPVRPDRPGRTARGPRSAGHCAGSKPAGPTHRSRHNTSEEARPPAPWPPPARHRHRHRSAFRGRSTFRGHDVVRRPGGRTVRAGRAATRGLGRLVFVSRFRLKAGSTDTSTRPAGTHPGGLTPQSASGVPGRADGTGTSMSNPLQDPEFFRNPYPTYAALRSASPVREVPGGGGRSSYLVTGYAEAREAFTDPRLSKDAAAFFAGEDTGRNLHPAVSRSMLATDPPRHTRLRSLVTKAFTPGAVARLRPYIAGVTDALLDQWVPGEPTDAVATLAGPLPVAVICRLLGFPTPTTRPSGPGRTNSSRPDGPNGSTPPRTPSPATWPTSSRPSAARPTTACSAI